jgi:hypothetical protein
MCIFRKECRSNEENVDIRSSRKERRRGREEGREEGRKE